MKYKKDNNKLVSKKFLIIFIFLILLIGIFHIALVYAQDSSEKLVPVTMPGLKTGSTATGTSAGTNTDEYSKYIFAVPGNEKPLNIGQVAIKNGKPEDVQLSGGKFENPPNPDNKPIKGGEFKAAGIDKDGKETPVLNVDGKPAPDTGYFKSKANEFKNVKDGSSVDINENGRINEIEIKGKDPVKDGKKTEITIEGKDKDVSLSVPKDAILEKKPGADYTLTMPKEGGKLEMPVVKNKKPEEEDSEGYDPRFRIISEGLSEIPQELSAKAGFTNGLSFKTIGSDSALIFNSDGTWKTEGKVEFDTLGKDGKSIVAINNLGDKYTNINKDSYLFFGRDSFTTPEGKALYKSGIAGVVIDAEKKDILSFSTNDKLGPYVELGAGNPFNGYKSAIIPEANSAVSISGGNKESVVQFQGNGMFYGGEGNTFRYQSSDFSFKKGDTI